MLFLGDVVAFEDMLDQVDIALTDKHLGHPMLSSMIKRKKQEVARHREKAFVHEDDIETYLEDNHSEIMEYCGQSFTFDEILMEFDYLEICDTIWYIVEEF